MPFTYEEKCFIKILRREKGLGAKRICSEYHQKKWSVSSVRDLLRKIDKTGSVERKPGSGCPRSVRTQRNISRVSELICSQEDNPGKSPCNIEKVTGISRSSVRRIVKRDLRLNAFRCKKAQLLSDTDRQKRVKCCKTLLRRRCLLNVDNVWFSDEKIFTVQPPINTQNDRVYDTARKKSSVASRRLIKGRKHFSESMMASVAVSKAGKTSVHFI